MEIKISYNHFFVPSDVALIFLPGYAGDQLGKKATHIAHWAIRNKIEYVTFDYRGVGLSQGDFYQQTLGGWLADANTAFNKLQAPKKIIIGSSMGGWISLLLASKKAVLKQLQGMILLAPAVDFPELLLNIESDANIKEALNKDGKIPLGKPNKEAGESQLYITKKFIDESSNHRMLVGRKDKIDTGCPVTIILGDHDEAVPIKHAEFISENILGSKLLILNGADHRLSNEEDLKVIEEELNTLISKKT